MSPLSAPMPRLGIGFFSILLLASGTWSSCADPDDPGLGPTPMPIIPSPVRFVSGVGPSPALWGAVLGDFDGDGVPDLAGVTARPAYLIETGALLGNGDGTFGTRRMASFGFADWGLVAAADFNGDGKTDLVEAGGGGRLAPPNFYVGLSDGSRFVTATMSSNPGANVSAMIAGDMNGDKVADLLTYYSAGNSLLQAGTGTGNFASGAGTGGPDHRVDSWSVDANHDGTIDLVASFDYQSLQLKAGGASVVLDAPLQGLAIADFNHDGVLDIAILVKPPAGTESEVRVLPGRGAYSLDPPIVTKLGGGTNARWLEAADFDRDGKPDLALVVEDMLAAGVLRGKGDGTFQPAAYYEASDNAGGLIAQDWNKDGKPDLVVAGSPTRSLLGDGLGGLVAARAYPLPALGLQPAAAADLDNDGKVDLVLTGWDASKTVQVAALMNQGAAALRATTAMPVMAGREIDGTVTGDFNGDGKADVAVTTRTGAAGVGELHVLIGNGDGSFQPPRTRSLGVVPTGIVAGDLNEDGHLDLLVDNLWSSAITILLGNGDGSFVTPSQYPAGYGPLSPQLLDVNLDGHLDVVVLNRYQTDRRYDTVAVLLGKGDGTLQPPLSTDLFSTYGEVAFNDWFGINDWDHDGKPDLLICGHAKATTGAPTADWSGVLLLRGNGRGQFVRGPLTPATTASPDCPVVAGDMNGDGEVDLLGSSSVGPNIWLSQRDGSFTSPTSVIAQSHREVKLLADMNGDKKLDLIEFAGRAATIRLNLTP